MTNVDSVMNTSAQFKSINLVNGYSGTVSLANTLTVQTFQMRSGNIAQLGVDSMYREIIVTEQFDWSGGILNTSENAGTVILKGVNGTIDPMEGQIYSNCSFELDGEEYEESTLNFGIGELLGEGMIRILSGIWTLAAPLVQPPGEAPPVNNTFTINKGMQINNDKPVNDLVGQWNFAGDTGIELSNKANFKIHDADLTFSLSKVDAVNNPGMNAITVDSTSKLSILRSNITSQYNMKFSGELKVLDESTISLAGVKIFTVLGVGENANSLIFIENGSKITASIIQVENATLIGKINQAKLNLVSFDLTGFVSLKNTDVKLGDDWGSDLSVFLKCVMNITGSLDWDGGTYHAHINTNENKVDCDVIKTTGDLTFKNGKIYAYRMGPQTGFGNRVWKLFESVKDVSLTAITIHPDQTDLFDSPTVSNNKHYGFLPGKSE